MFYTHCSFSVAQQSSRRGLILPPDSRVHLCLEYFLLPCHISLTSLSFPSASLCLTGSYYFCIFTASHAALMQSKRNDDDWMNGLNPSLLLYRQILHHLSHQGSPYYIDTYCQIWNHATFIKSKHSLPCKADNLP